MWQIVKEHQAVIDLELVNELVNSPRGIVVPVSRPDMSLEKLLAAARHVENALPENATWDGNEKTYFTAEEFEAAARARRQRAQSTSTSAAEPAKKNVASSEHKAASGGAL
jgi:hypothetical protein